MKLIRSLLLCAGGLLCLAGCTHKPAQSDAESPASSAVQTTVSAAETTTETIPETITETAAETTSEAAAEAVFDPADIPPYSGKPFCTVNGNIPFFSEPFPAEHYEYYSPLDALGRCGVCEACISEDMLPQEKRGSIGEVKPSGWHLIRYDGLVDGNYLYNRCHLIAHMLTGQNANASNLITGTRYLNKEGMLPFEIMTVNYIRESGNHVLYRVTPVFTGENLLADGVLMEALSLEDGGSGLCFNVYCYNVHPGIEIDYTNGDSRLAESAETAPAERVLPQTEETQPAEPVQTETEAVTAPPAPVQSDAAADYILNTNTMRFHKPDCPSVEDISDRNKAPYSGSREELLAIGYAPCKRCQP